MGRAHALVWAHLLAGSAKPLRDANYICSSPRISLECSRSNNSAGLANGLLARAPPGKPASLSAGAPASRQDRAKLVS